MSTDDRCRDDGRAALFAQMRCATAALLVVVALVTAGCGEAEPPDVPPAGDATEAPDAADDERLSVYVVNYPLQYFVERIGGQRVDVTFPAPRDVDPTEWMPDSQTIRAYQDADVILLHGADYARWRDLVSLPMGATVNTSAAFRDRLLEVPDAYVHAHGPDGELHAHAGVASITWLDPTLAIEHARAIKQALSERRPAHAEAFADRFDALAEELHELDAKTERTVNADPDRPLLASEPVYHYLEARYGLNLEVMQWHPQRMPDDESWSALDEKLNDHNATRMLWPEEPKAEIASRLAERGIAPVVYAPSDQPPDSGDLMSVMRQNAANLRGAFDDEDA